MMVIWKFPLTAADLQTIQMPADAEVLTIQVQVGPCLWAWCDQKAAKTERFFETFGTGKPIPPANRKYVGTYQLRDAGLVFHVFERLQATETESSPLRFSDLTKRKHDRSRAIIARMTRWKHGSIVTGPCGSIALGLVIRVVRRCGRD